MKFIVLVCFIILNKKSMINYLARCKTYLTSIKLCSLSHRPVYFALLEQELDTQGWISQNFMFIFVIFIGIKKVIYLKIRITFFGERI